MRIKQAYIEETGGPDVICWRETDVDAPGDKELLVRHEAIGVNYIDTYHRDGTYPIELPGMLGMEAAGVVEAVGEGVTGFGKGDRVAILGPGAYATGQLVAAESATRLPHDVSSETAAAVMLKGQTAEFLVERCAKVQAGMTVLVHAGAGATGQLLIQWLKAIDARVITTVSTDEKAGKARAAGADHVIRYDRDGVADGVKELTGGAGVPVVFDGVGRATFGESLKSCARRGLVVSFGNASGTVEGVNLGVLASHGSLYVTRPTMFDYYATRKDAEAGRVRLFEMLSSGKVSVEIGQRYPLDLAADAHRDLEARKTIGATVLLP